MQKGKNTETDAGGVNFGISWKRGKISSSRGERMDFGLIYKDSGKIS